MKLNTTEELIKDLSEGRMVILMDDEDRENEGDIVMAAQHITAETINFMAKHARGLICLTMSRAHCERLKLPLMVNSNGTPYSTNFTVSIEAASGVTTGISAADRALTVRVAVDPEATADSIIQPGHIFPLMAQPGGVLSRAGHTEAGCDLARLAGMSTHSSVIVEIMNDDGTMARRPDLEVFAKEHGLKIGTIADLIEYRVANEQTIERLDTRVVNTEYGEFNVTRYKDSIVDRTHLAFTRGEIEGTALPVRVHLRSEMLRDVAAVSSDAAPKWTFRRALQRIADEGRGVAVLLDTGAPNDLGEAIAPYIVGAEEPAAAARGSYLMVGTGSQILRDLGVTHMQLMSSPMKFNAISGFGLFVDSYLEPQSERSC